MRAAPRFRLPLAIAVGLISFTCLLSSSSALGETADPPPYLDPSYATKLLQIVQDRPAWYSVEESASANVRDTLAKARLEAVRASLPEPRTLWTDATNGLKILPDTANGWKWVVYDTGQTGLRSYVIKMGTGLGTVAPFVTGHDRPGHAYWKYLADGKVSIYVCAGACDYHREFTVNGGQPVWAAHFTGTDDSIDWRAIRASALFDGCSAWCKNLYMDVRSFVPATSPRLQTLERGVTSTWTGYCLHRPGIGVFAWYGSPPSYGHYCDENDEELYGPIATPTWSARWMDASGIPNDPVEMSTPATPEGSFSAQMNALLRWDLDAARAVIGSSGETTNWVNCQLLRGPTTDLSQCAPPLEPQDLELGPMGGSYASSASLFWADPVNTSNGNFVRVETDTSLFGPGVAFDLERTYNSRDKATGPFGRGWASSLFPSLTIDGWGYVQLRADTGQRINYALQPDGTFEADRSVRARLTKTDIGYALEITSEQTTQNFDEQGRIMSSLDGNGVGLGYEYDDAGRLVSITDGGGRRTTFELGAGGRIVRANLPDGGTVSYAYEGNLLVSATDPAGATTHYAYDGEGRMSKVTDPNGEVSVQNSYDASGRVTDQTDAFGRVTHFDWATGSVTVTDPSGRTWTDNYNDGGQISSRTDALGNTVNFAFDGSNNALSFRNARGKTTSMTYDERGNMLTKTTPDEATESWTYDDNDQVTSHTDQLGNVSRNEYDSNGNLVKEIDATGAATTSSYDAEGKLVAKADPLGRTTHYLHDGKGDQIATVSPSGAKTTMRYDDGGRLVAEVGPRGNEPGADPADYTTSYRYDAAGRVVETTDALGRTTKTTYNAAGRVTSETDAKGNVTGYKYDGNGNKIAETAADGGVTSYEWDVNGKHVLIETDPLGNVTRYTYDRAGHQTSVTTPSGAVTTYEYDAAGNKISTTDPLGNETTTEYDALNRPVETTDALGGVTKTVYDAAGHVVSVTDPLGHETTFVYDVNGNLATTTDPLGRSTTSQYDAAGQLVSETDAKGNTTSYAYDAEGRKTSEQAPDGATTTFAYDAAGNLIRETDANGHVTSYAYDAADRKIGMTTPLGAHWSYSYDENGNQVAAEDPLGKETRTIYDELDRETESTDALGGAIRTAYDLAGQVVSITDPLGNETTSEYDADGRLVKTTDPLGDVMTSSYDAAGQLIAETDAKGHTTAYAYDAGGQKISVTAPDGGVTRSAYDAAGNLIARTDENGHVTSYAYDAGDQKIGMTNALGSHWTYSYDANGNLVSTEDALGNTATKAYDRLDREIESKDALGDATKTAYDAVGNVVSVIDPLGNETTSSYDAENRLLKTTDPLGHETSSSYDAAGRVTSETDANGHTTSYAYDANGQKTSVTAPDGATTTFAYDAGGNLLERTDANGHLTAYAYDAAGRKTSMTNPLGSSWTYFYDAAGNLTRTETPSGGTISRTYDAADRLLEKSYSDGTPAVSYVYDPAGNRISMTDGVGTTSYAYDAANRQIAASGPDGGFTYIYDPNGNLLSRTYPNGRETTYLYDAAGGMATATTSEGTTYYGYDATGKIVSTLHPNDTLDARSYDAAGRLTGIEGTRGNGRLLYSRSYTLDPEGNPLSVTGTRPGRRGQVRAWTETYSYDSQDRLARACMNARCSRFFEYAYDGVGNRLSERTERGTTSYDYDEADELTRERKPGPDVTYSYDASGNQTRKGDARYTYDLENELTGLREGRTRVSYTYSGDGLVTTKTVQGGERISYSWDSNASLAQLALERDTRTGRTLRSYAYGQGPLELEARRDTLTYHTDSLGSTIELSDEDGREAASYRYSPYGEEWAGSSSTPEADSNPLRFTGQYLDSDSGLYYMRAREYDPENGRFLETDPQEEEIGDYDLSDYIYAEDDPTLLTDPSGLDPRFHGKTLTCKKNKYLCKLIYAVGYTDGCTGYYVRKALSTLYWRGIYLEHILKAANKKGKVVNSTDGPDGPGLYFVNYGDGTTLIEPPQDQECGWICSVGLATTQVLGCDSSRGCVMQAALLYTPGGGSVRLAKWTERIVNVARKSKTLKKAGTGLKKTGRIVKSAKRGKNVERTGSVLARQSEAAFRAADNIGSFVLPAKHLPGAGGGYSKFAKGIDPYRAISEALRSEQAVFRINPGQAGDRFRVVTDLGRVVGTKGQTKIRAVVSNAGRVITAFPVK